MAQYRSDLKILDSGQVTTRYEVMMLSDQLTPSGALVDAFGRLRVSEPYTLFDNTLRYSDDTRNWDISTSGTGSSTHDANSSSVLMTIGTSSGDKVIRQTKRYFMYQPGKSLLMLNTFTMQPKANVRQRVGNFDAKNGIFLEHDGTTAYIVKRSYSTGTLVETKVPQSEWSEDKFDGTGLSKTTLDFSKSQIFWTNIEWLGVGSVKTGFVIDGKIYAAHAFHHANSTTSTYMGTATLPVRYEIENIGNAASSTSLRHICNTVISEGGHSPRVSTRSASTALTGVNVSNASFSPVIALRLKSDRPGAVAVPAAVDLFGLQATPFIYKILSDVTITGGTWNTTSTESHVEYNTTMTGFTGTGRDYMQGVFTGGTASTPIRVMFKDFDSSYQLRTRIDGTNEVFLVAVQATTNNDDAIASILWEEYN
jgi:hypothetical protein